jgi:hypothetical protein
MRQSSLRKIYFELDVEEFFDGPENPLYSIEDLLEEASECQASNLNGIKVLNDFIVGDNELHRSIVLGSTPQAVERKRRETKCSPNPDANYREKINAKELAKQYLSQRNVA